MRLLVRDLDLAPMHKTWHLRHLSACMVHFYCVATFLGLGKGEQRVVSLCYKKILTGHPLLALEQHGGNGDSNPPMPVARFLLSRNISGLEESG